MLFHHGVHISITSYQAQWKDSVVHRPSIHFTFALFFFIRAGISFLEEMIW